MSVYDVTTDGRLQIQEVSLPNPSPEFLLQKDGELEQTFYRVCRNRKRGNGFNLKEGRLRVVQGRVFFNEGGEGLEGVAQRG